MNSFTSQRSWYLHSMQAMFWVSLSASYQTSPLIVKQEILSRVWIGPASLNLWIPQVSCKVVHIANTLDCEVGFPQSLSAFPSPCSIRTQTYSPVIAFSSSISPPQPVLISCLNHPFWPLPISLLHTHYVQGQFNRFFLSFQSLCFPFYFFALYLPYPSPKNNYCICTKVKMLMVKKIPDSMTCPF